MSAVWQAQPLEAPQRQALEFLLLGEGKALPFCRGDVVRFAQGDVHGLQNPGPEELVYLAVTAPPLDFRGAYQEAKESPAPYDSQG